ncbi:hypothetical protein LIER_02269 [Lithospermum erythrorhizon]|uniref:NAC domain-containing protein n=1 Tax=Lithospermum erythrorhizon TaxID=34254 RepID=A0AAV3NQ72_LITER
MAVTTLAPGFRFHPTDVELIMYYLKRKIFGKKLSVEAIVELNIYKFSPWDLPDKSRIKSNDREWYFFCPREKKYAKGGRVNRAAEAGYWKTTGRDRSIHYQDRIVGMLKTLIFHQGHPPKGERTDWVMHEYRMEDQKLADSGAVQDVFVICKVFCKDGPGPRNGAQYGAAFNEEEWDDDAPDCRETLPSGILSGATAGATQLLASSSTSELTNMGGPEVLSICPSFEQDPSSVPVEGVGIPLMEDDYLQSLLASFIEEEEDIPADLSYHENNNVGNPVNAVGFSENDTYSGLPDLGNCPALYSSLFNVSEMQAFPGSYLELNDLETPLNLAEDTNLIEYMLGDNYDYNSVPSLLCNGGPNFEVNQYCSSSTQIDLQAAEPSGPWNPSGGGVLNQNSDSTHIIPFLATGHLEAGDLSRSIGGAGTLVAEPGACHLPDYFKNS